MGCIGRLGCLVLVLLIGALAWLNRASWLPYVRAGDDQRPDSPAATASRDGLWQPLSVEGGVRARRALESLRQANGPSAVTVSVPDLAAYVYEELARQFPKSADSVEAMAIRDQLHVRARVRLQELWRDALGPLAAMLGEHERLHIGGNLRVVRPGLGELVVQEMRVGELRLPAALVPRIIRQTSRSNRPPELSDSGIPLKLPDYIGRIDVSGGNIVISRVAR